MKRRGSLVLQVVLCTCAYSCTTHRNRLSAAEQPYKLDILEHIRDAPITIYHIDNWFDLCAGPHVPSTGDLRGSAIELESVAGVYWRGDENNKPMLQVVHN